MQGDRVTVSSVKLPRATSVRLQPVRYSFTQLPNPKSVLEGSLGLGYTTLTRDTSISVACGPRESDVHELVVRDLQPARCAYVMGSALPVEFDEPQGVALVRFCCVCVCVCVSSVIDSDTS